jgi:raffinose/stachyose/melibiose transport system permease protein
MSLLKKRPFLTFIFPGFVLYTLFVVYPIISALRISFTEWSGIGPKTFVGFRNYVELVTDRSFFPQLVNALTHNLTIFGLNAIILVPLQIYIAYLIYNDIRGRRFFQVVFFAPQFILSPVIVILFTLVFDQNVGVFNALLKLVGLEQLQQPWLGMPQYGIYVVWLMGLWAGLGVSMLFFVGAMRTLPKDTLEAATIDGAGFWTTLFRIVIPQIRVTVVNIYVLTYIFSFTAFDYSFMLAGGTGSAGLNNAYDVMTLFFYRVAFGNVGGMGGSFEVNSMGMGTTIACVLFFIIAIVSFVQLRIAFRMTQVNEN